jgi:hypothetical protein
MPSATPAVPGLPIAVGVLAVAAVAWLLTLVPLGRAVLAPQGPRRRRLPRWGLAHAAAWAGLLGAFGWLIGAAWQDTAGDYLVAAIFLGAFPALEAGLLRLADALAAPGREPARPAIPVWLVWTPALVTTVLLAGSLARGLVRPRPVDVPIAVAVGAFLAFMAGVVRFALASGRPMTREEMESQISGTRLIGAPNRRGVFRTRLAGEAVGRQAEETLTLAGIKRAWRAHAWRGSPRWQGVFLMLGGGVLMVFAGLAIGAAAGPLAIRLLAGVAGLYAAVRLVIAWRKA